MPHNVLITGPPRSGKTTVVQGVVDRLEDRGFRIGGIACPERRRGGDRVGFDVVDLATGDARTLAHVDRESGPSVGKYRVNVDGLDALCETAFRRAFDRADGIVVDEIAPMEIHSDAFRRNVRTALDSAVPVVAAIHFRSTRGFIGDVKERDDVDRYEVTADSRDGLPDEIASSVLEWL